MRPGPQRRHRLRSPGRGLDLLRQRDAGDIDGDLLQPLLDLRLALRLVASTEMGREELLRLGIGGEVVDRPREPVPLVWRHQVLDRQLALTQGDDDLIRLRLLDPRIVRALDHQQRHLDPAGRVERRLPLEQRLAFGCRWISHSLVEESPRRLPVGRNRLEEGQQVGGTNDRNATRVDVRREGEARQRRISTVGAAHDPDPLRIGDSLAHEIPDSPGQVVLHRLSPLLVPRVEELLPIPGRTSEVGLEDRIAPIGQKLREGVVAPHITRPRPAVRKDDEGQVFGGDSLGQGQVGGDLQSIR